MAGLTYTGYGYFSNTVMGATSIVLMALLVRFFLPEPSAESASEVAPKVAGASPMMDLRL